MSSLVISVSSLVISMGLSCVSSLVISMAGGALLSVFPGDMVGGALPGDQYGRWGSPVCLPW